MHVDEVVGREGSSSGGFSLADFQWGVERTEGTIDLIYFAELTVLYSLFP